MALATSIVESLPPISYVRTLPSAMTRAMADSILNLQCDIFGFAGCFVDDDKVTAIVATELLVGVQKLDAIDRTIWRNVHVERIAHLDGFYLRGFLVKAQ